MESRGHRKVREGRVCSAVGNKTIAVLIERRVRHPLLGKELRVTKKIHAHDENNECNEGDIVIIESTRPISKHKSWRLQKIVTKAV